MNSTTTFALESEIKRQSLKKKIRAAANGKKKKNYEQNTVTNIRNRRRRRPLKINKTEGGTKTTRLTGDKKKKIKIIITLNHREKEKL